MGKSKECFGFRNEEIRLYESWGRHANGSSTVGPKAGQFCKRTIAVLVMVVLAALGQKTDATKADQFVYRWDATNENETEETTAAYRHGLMEEITSNNTESDQTTISWMQFMAEDAANWHEDNDFDVAQHIRLKRAADGEGSGSGIATTDDMTTGDFTTTTVYTTEAATTSTEAATDDYMTTDGSGVDETVSTTGFNTDVTTAGITVTPSSAVFETSQSESATESATTQMLTDTSKPVTVTSVSTDDFTDTTDAGSGMEDTVSPTIADTTATEYRSTEPMTATDATESLTETSNSITITSTSSSDDFTPSGTSVPSTDSFTETTDAGSGIEDTVSPTIADTTATEYRSTEPMTGTDATQSLTETSNAITITSTSSSDDFTPSGASVPSTDSFTETTEAGSGIEDTVSPTIAVTTATEYRSTESTSSSDDMTPSDTSVPSTGNPSTESTAESETTQSAIGTTNPVTVTSGTSNGLTATTGVGSDVEEPTSTAISDDTTASFLTEQSTESTEETSTVASSTSAVSCDSVTCPNDNTFCTIIEGVAKCECNLGYYKMDNGTCGKAKVFGAILHIDIAFNTDLLDTSSEYYSEQVDASLEFLTACYGGESWFIKVDILGFSSGSTLVEHQIITQDDQDVDASVIENTFSAFMADDAYFSDCSCSEAVCNASSSSTLALTASILANDSCADAGTKTDLACNTTTADQYCSTGAHCSATLGGVVTCDCDEDLVPVQDSLTTCVVVSVCSSGTGCNQPFGTCDESRQICTCMWGFQGDNCQTIWLFVLVICLAGLVFIGLIVAVAWWCRRGHSKAYDSNPYSNAGAMTVSLDRFHSMSEWDEKIGGVVPTSYKRISDSEGVDSAYERSSASGDFDQNSDSRGVTLRNWRVSEIGSGDRRSNGSNGNEYVERPVQLSTFQQVPGDSEVIGQTRI